MSVRRFLASSICALRASRAVLLALVFGQPPGLVHLLKQIDQAERARRLVGVVILEHRQREHEVGELLAASGVRDLLDVLDQLRNVQEQRHGRPFLRFLVDQHAGAHAAVRVAAAAHRAPVRFRPVRKIGEFRERADHRNREPVASRLDFSDLAADVLGQMRKRVALLHAPLGSDFLVAARERNRLERHEGKSSPGFPSRTSRSAPT